MEAAALPIRAADAPPWPANAYPLRRVLDLSRPAVGAAAVADAETALASALAGVAGSAWPEVAWQFSVINGDGFPVEVTFSSEGPAVRYTTEVTGPETAEARRVHDAVRWAGWLALPGHLRRTLRGVQRGPLRWGAWGGGLHAPQQSRRKIYVEAARGVAFPAMAAAPPRAVLRFVGIAAPGNEREYYLRCDRLELAETGRLLRALSLQDCYEPLREAVTDALPRTLAGRLLPTDAGFSCGDARAFSVFTFARSLWGGDGAIRRHVLRLAERRGWDMDVYEQVTRPLASSCGYRTQHGVLAWIAVPGRPVELRISIRPPG